MSEIGSTHEWVTQRQAAELLGVHVSLVPEMVRRGDLHPRATRPSLSRDEVLQLKAAREAAAAERESRRVAPPDRLQPPDDEHDWLAAPAAPASRPGAILGLMVLTAFVLWIASRAVRRMEISYGSET